jgi:3'-phosphoadenosine 5'-phosphosulfate sulfotransferase (PAPS reductase)/FAD synthetase
MSIEMSYNKTKVVVPVSGGKDSQACLKLALQSFDRDEVLGLFCDTRFEHPLTYQHIDKMSEMYGVKIQTICAGSVEEKVLKYRRFPGGGARFCTEELKIVPAKKFYKELAEHQREGFEVWLGMRADESAERGKRYIGLVDTELHPPHEVLKKFPKYLAKMGVMFRLPVIDWTEFDVFEYLDGQQNSLYGAGFSRVGCFPCLASGDRHKEKAFSYGEFGREQRVIVGELEQKIGRSVFKSKGGMMRNNEDQYDLFTGCSMCAI